MNEREKTIYKKCLAEYPIETEEDIRPYSAENCTEKGFISILFFYYFYFYLRRNGFKSLKDVIPLLDTMPARAAAVSPLDSTTFSHVAEMMLTKKREAGLTWRSILIRMNREDLATYRDTIAEVIEPIVKLGLYVYMLLNKHAVVLMNAHHGHFVIKNSWGYPNDVVPYGLDIPLRGNDKVYTLEYLELFLPMTTTFSAENETRGVYTSDAYIHVRELYPFIRKYVATYQRAGGKTRRTRRKKTYTRLVCRLRQ